MAYPDNVRIVLVGPENPGNVGATARAMMVMGLSKLYIVNPTCNLQADEAYWLAHNAADVLRRAHVVSSLPEALADTVFSVGTTRRVRRQKYPLHTPEEVAQLLLAKPPTQEVAIVFGRESKGLFNEELALCSVHSTIPSHDPEQSLNLAQAVMIYTYAVYQASLTPQEREFPWKLATHHELEFFYGKLAETLVKRGTRPASTMENFVARFRRVFSRIPVETRDLNLLYRLFLAHDAPHAEAADLEADDRQPGDQEPAELAEARRETVNQQAADRKTADHEHLTANG